MSCVAVNSLGDEDDIPLPKEQSSPLWPKPAVVELGENELQLSNNFSFEFEGNSSSDRLNRGFERYTKMYRGGGTNSGTLKKCTVEVDVVLPEVEERASLTLNVEKK